MVVSHKETARAAKAKPIRKGKGQEPPKRGCTKSKACRALSPLAVCTHLLISPLGDMLTCLLTMLVVFILACYLAAGASASLKLEFGNKQWVVFDEFASGGADLDSALALIEHLTDSG